MKDFTIILNFLQVLITKQIIWVFIVEENDITLFFTVIF